MALLARLAEAPEAEVEGDFLAAMAAVADDDRLDPAFKALVLTLPPEDEIIAHLAALGRVPDPLAVHHARRRLDRALAEALGTPAGGALPGNAVPGPYSPDAGAAGRRALRSRALALITHLDPEPAQAQFDAADNMTERMSALVLLVAHGVGDGGAGAVLRRAGQHDRLVIDKWFAVQAGADAARGRPSPPWSGCRATRTSTGRIRIGSAR